MYHVFVFVLAYLLGSIPNGLLIGKRFCGIDLREHGSHNIGATNAYRILGAKPAFFVFLADFTKGALGVLLGQLLVGDTIALLVGGMGAIIGHNWSVFINFTGGRGVATGLGVITLLAPIETFILFSVWVAIVYFTRYVSLASITAAALVPILMWFFNEPIEYLIFGIIAATFVIYRHKANIGRLIKGEELKITPAKRK